MSAGPHALPGLSAPLCPGAPEGSAAEEPPSGPAAEMETLRLFVNERLAAAVDDILGVFVKTVARYREQIELQRRQLDRLRPEESDWGRAEGRGEPPILEVTDPSQASSWIKRCPDEHFLSVHPDRTDSTDETGSGTSAAPVKSEAGGEDCGEPDGDCDPAAGWDRANNGRPLTESSETEDSGDYWREAAGLWKAEETGEAAGAPLSPRTSARSCTDLSQECEPSRPPLPLFSCKVCGESFQRSGHLLTHASAHVRDCSLCGKHLEHGENLKLHLRLHRETSFCCSVCGQSFTLRGNLRTHMRIHSGERPYGCTVCGKSFGRRATLVRHVRSHTGEKPFNCTYCGRGFVEKGNLTVHLRTHTGERPYWCSVCDRRFSQLSSFYKHPCQRRSLTADFPKT